MTILEETGNKKREDADYLVLYPGCEGLALAHVDNEAAMRKLVDTVMQEENICRENIHVFCGNDEADMKAASANYFVLYSDENGCGFDIVRGKNAVQKLVDSLVQDSGIRKEDIYVFYCNDEIM